MSLFGKLFTKPKREEDVPAPSPPPPVPHKVPVKHNSGIQREEGTPYYKVVCPFCLEECDVWELEFRSLSIAETDDEEGYQRTVDEKYKKFWQDMKLPKRDVDKGFVLNVDDTQNVISVKLWENDEWIPAGEVSRKAVKCVRDKYGNISKQHICPKCHNDLPAAIGRYPNYIISMMGNTTSGKTVYMSRLLLSLISGEFMPEHVFVTELSEEPLHVMKRRLQNMFLQAARGLKDVSDDEDGSHLAEGTSIQYMEPTVLDFIRGNEHILVTLFDFPGEALTKLSDDDQSFFNKMMHKTNEKANGWIILLDSTTLAPIKSCIQELEDYDYINNADLENVDKNAEPDAVLEMFHKFVAEGEIIKPPTALVFSKSDMIGKYVEMLQGSNYDISQDSPFLKDSPPYNKDMINLDDIFDCDEAIRAFLKSSGGQRLLKGAEVYFHEYAWFATSAIGTPIKNGVLNKMASARRVLEPLGWLLWMMGAYPGECMQGRNGLNSPKEES